MSLNNKLDEILNQPSKIKIFRFLFNEKDEYSGRAIAKAISMSVSYTHLNLQQLRNTGVINVRRKGNLVLYSLNENNYFIKNLIAPLFTKEKALYPNLVALIKRYILKDKISVISIAIFGSVAKMEDKPKSDIDLLILTTSVNSRDKVIKLTDDLDIKLAKDFNIALSPYILTKKEAIEKHTKKEAIMESILKNNKLIYGDPIERILA